MKPSQPRTRWPVTLVGAGPGDPELLTLKAVRAIAAADVILMDDLVNEEVLVHARPDARVIRVGKRGGCASTPQAFIDRLMIQQARRGLRVVRLKGGDPFILGRGGEEIEQLRAAGLEVDVINGITAGLAAATALQTALTHRRFAHGVVFITGHGAPGQAEPDWVLLGQAAAALKLTLVVYMGITRAADIQSGLLGSLPGATPAAVVQHATLANQRVAVTTLERLVETLVSQGLGSPSIIIVGEVLQALAALAHADEQASSHGAGRRAA